MHQIGTAGALAAVCVVVGICVPLLSLWAWAYCSTQLITHERHSLWHQRLFRCGMYACASAVVLSLMEAIFAGTNANWIRFGWSIGSAAVAMLLLLLYRVFRRLCTCSRQPS